MQDESVRLVTDEILEHRAALQDLIRYLCRAPCPAQQTDTLHHRHCLTLLPAPHHLEHDSTLSQAGSLQHPSNQVTHAGSTLASCVQAWFQTIKLPCSKVVDMERERQGGPEDVEADWGRYPEDAAASVVHHSAILRNKRLLLIYTCAPCCMPSPPLQPLDQDGAARVGSSP